MNKTCYLFGSKSLLIQCYNTLIKSDYVIKAIVSDDLVISKWAKSNNIEIIAGKNLAELHNLGSVDYIFSITHLSIIPDDILKLASKLAINFHDGILPGYAGLNVTSWAIYHQEKEHGVTWHEMLADVDQGNILKQDKFDIDENETAFTLNAKCYESALSSFSSLINDINNNELQSLDQDSSKSVFYQRNQRMPVMATLNWQEPASQLDAMVRALNFGSYANPLNIAKFQTNNEIYYVLETEVIESSLNKPGTVLSIEPFLDISTTNNGLRIKKILNANGKSVDVSTLVNQEAISVGSVLNNISQELSDNLSKVNADTANKEGAWLKELDKNLQLVLPNVKQANSDEIQFESLIFKFDQSEKKQINSDSDVQSLLTLFFARLTCTEDFQLYINVKSAEENQLYFDNCLPVEFNVDFNQSIDTNLKVCNKILNTKSKDFGFSRDLVFRNTQSLPKINAKKIVLTSANEINQYSDLNYELNIIYDSVNCELIWNYNNQNYDKNQILQLQSMFSHFLENINQNRDNLLSNINLLSNDEYQKIVIDWNKTASDYDREKCIHQLFESQVRSHPESIALSYSGQLLTYKALNEQSNKIAHKLISAGVKPDQLVAVYLDRSINMIVALLGILKSGAAYLPLDPNYPVDRLQYMLEDGNAAAIITQSKYIDLLVENDTPRLFIDDDSLQSMSSENPDVKLSQNNLAYTIYTSGSTGLPKGVMVEHGNVINFFHGMNQHIDKPIDNQKKVWLAVTSISFDISVLEIFWTLANGFEVAIYADESRSVENNVESQFPDKDMQFSLFYWNVAEDESDYDEDIYRLLMESVKFADNNSFKAVWTPERHFHSFGGIFPNPSVTSAAIAAATKNVEIRAGSCVIPLHHPVRVAEDWAMIDNISHGRVGIAVAAGWQPNDFVIMPQNHANAKDVMFESLDTVQKLWRGETVEFPGPKGNMIPVSTLPRPIQKELPVWVTAAGNPETFRMAGEVGAGVLTHLLGQSVEDVSKNIIIYRQAYKEAGHKGEGTVTLLLHTLVGNDDEQVKELAREPMKKYLKSAMFLVKNAAWHFPTFKNLSSETGKTLDEFFETISDEDMDGLLDFAFERYYQTSGLFGTPERCMKMVDSLKEIGVNEIGCLIDYGLDTDIVLEHLPHLNKLRTLGEKQKTSKSKIENQSIPEIINDREVTHLQCTPSMVKMLLAEEETVDQLKKLKHVLIGGEALPLKLASDMTKIVSGKVSNMYGPTETTIWSTVADIPSDVKQIKIGRPIANTEIYILDKMQQPVPIGIAGELYISGSGVVRGYHNKVDLNQQKFINNPFKNDSALKMYATGDLAKYDEDGQIECLGRIDHQIKIRGYRIELGEIESLLTQLDSVKEAIVILREDTPNDKRLVAYIVPNTTTEQKNEFDASTIKGALSHHLPEFMVPSIFIEIDETPLTPNGKVDRKALPKPKVITQTSISTKIEPPENDTQEKILVIWRNVLGIAQISLDDNFFDIGGHSLLVVEVLSELRKLIDKPIKMIDMFRFSTIRQFSQHIDNDDAGQQNFDKSQERADARKAARSKMNTRRKSRLNRPAK